MSKISFILFGLLVVLAVLASAENEEQSLSEQLSSMRVIRNADAGNRKKNRNKKNRRKNKKNKEIRIRRETTRAQEIKEEW